MNRNPGYETRDASPAIAAGAIGGVFVLVALVLLAVGVIVYLQRRGEPPPAATAVEQVEVAPTGPRLQPAPRADRIAQEAPWRRRLETYGWADERRGLAHIPIERAIALQAEQGWPDAEAVP